MISIIIPVYNTEKFLNRCIDSILSQTYSDFELILVDDGSSDTSGDICDEYARADKRIKAFHKPNGGVSSARNFGIDKSTGEWVTFIDSDDYVSPYLLYDYVSRMNTDAQLFIQGYNDLNGLNLHKIFKDQTFVYDDCFKESELLRKKDLYFYVFNKLFRLDIIKQYNLYFDLDVTMAEDTIFVFQYLKCIKSVCHISVADYFYEINDNSASKKNHSAISWHKWFETLSSLYLPYIDKDPQFAFRELKHIWNCMIDAINDKYFRNSSRRERKNMILILKHSPVTPKGIYSFSFKGIISLILNFMPVSLTDTVLYVASRFKLRNRSRRLEANRTQIKLNDLAAYNN